MLTITENGLSFTNEEKNFGVKDLGLRLVVAGEMVDIIYGHEIRNGDELVSEGVAGDVLTMRATVKKVEGLEAVVFQHRLMNASRNPVRVAFAATGQFRNSSAVLPGKGSGLGWDLRYCHTDNVRTELYVGIKNPLRCDSHMDSPARVSVIVF